MNQQLAVLIPETVMSLFLICAFIMMLVASIYDVRQTMQKKSIQGSQSKFRRARKPTVSIIVQAHNNAESIKYCLDSIRRNRYPHYDIVVVDNESTDETREIVKLYIQKYQLLPLRLYSKRYKRGRVESIDQGYKRSQKGDLILDIDASSTITKSFIKDCAVRFWHDDKLQLLHFNVNNRDSGSINLLYFSFRQQCESMLNKFFSSFSRYRVNPNLGGVIYRRRSYNKTIKSADVFGNYSSSLVVSDCSVNDDKTAMSKQFSKEYSIYYFAFVIITLLLQTYSIYLAATIQSNLLLIIGWLAAALFLIIVTWSSEALNNKDKITLSFCAPFIYFLIYSQLVLGLFYVLARSFIISAKASQE